MGKKQHIQFKLCFFDCICTRTLHLIFVNTLNVSDPKPGFLKLLPCADFKKRSVSCGWLSQNYRFCIMNNNNVTSKRKKQKCGPSYVVIRPQQGNFLFLIQEVIKILCERALQLQNTAV